MDLAFVDSRYRTYSGKASDIVRALGFAALGVFWMFTDDGKTRPADSLSIAMIFVILSFGSDLLQYAFGVFTWHRFLKTLERGTRVKPEDQFLAPGIINWCTNVLFVSKLALMLLAYSAIIFFLSQRFAGTSSVQHLIGVIILLYALFVIALLVILIRVTRVIDEFEPDCVSGNDSGVESQSR